MTRMSMPIYTPVLDPEHFCGLDLGKRTDPSALVVLRKDWKPDPAAGMLAHYTLGYLHRWPLGTSYPAIVADVAKVVRTPPLKRPTLVVDQTGVGGAVVDLLEDADLEADVRAVIITGGHGATQGKGGTTNVPKSELASVLRALLPSHRLQVADVPGRSILVHELDTFSVKITAAGSETFEALRERDHDDLVLAVALAAWWAERSCWPFAEPLICGQPRRPTSGGPSARRF